MSFDREVITRISQCRNSLMGVAMLSVVLYHLYCWAGGHTLLHAFKYGYIGVDAFIFFSAFGLCYSYGKNSLKDFYCHRLIRIFPLYIVWRVLLLIVHLSFGGCLNVAYLKIFVLNITTLSYWLQRGDCSSWFVPAIIFLYVSFPVFFWFCSKFKIVGLMLCSLVGLLVAYYITPHIGWYYACLVDRIIVFMLGIIAYLVISKDLHVCGWCVLCWTAITILAISFQVSAFYITAMVVPLFVLASLLLCSYSVVNLFLAFIGKHSYELFLGHIFGYNISRRLGIGHGSSLCIDVIVYFAFSLLGFVALYLISRLLIRPIVIGNK